MKFYRSINIAGLIFSGLLLLNSCEDRLDIKPTAELESVYFETEDRVQRACGSMYAGLTNLYGPLLNHGAPHNLWLLPGDDICNDGTGNSDFEAFSPLNGANNRVAVVWDRYYQIIARANFVLDKLEDPSIQAVYVTPGLIDNNKGEALFFRSYCFYKLWDYYRKAPIQENRITQISDAYLPPSSGFEMLDKAIADLEKAVDLLPASWPAKYKGRVFKDSALGLLVKAYTMRACYNNKNTDDYQKAIAAYEKITTRHLMPNFGQNFDYRFENNDESIFEFQASHAPTQDNAWLDNNFGGDVGQMGAQYIYWTAYWGNYASGTFGPSDKMIAAFNPADPRRDETFRLSTKVVDLGGWWWTTFLWGKFQNYHMVKYINGDRGDCLEETWSISSANNTRLIRFADVKLCAAEAYLATGKADKALKEVNDIRERARKSTADGSEAAVPAAYASVDIQKIMDERFIELCGEEGHRWTDLRRWHAAGYINLGTWSATDFGYKYEAENFDFDVNKHLLYPIPISELDRNPLMAASGNNPGY
jgi:tetratricopeptide (TPR) repeat protein